MQRKTCLGLALIDNVLLEKGKGKRKTVVVFLVSIGAAERTRTFDLLINSQLHYRAVQRRQTLGVTATFSSTKVFKLNLCFRRFASYSIRLTLYLAKTEKPL